MSTVKQKKVAKKLVKALDSGEAITAGEIVESSGYGPSMKKNPQVILNSVGVKEELNKFGISLEKADSVVGYILEYGEKEDSQLNAADKVYKRLGGYAPEKSINIHAQFNLENKEEVETIASKVLEQMKNEEII